MIRTTPIVGNTIIVASTWFEPNEFFTQFMPNLKPNKVYEIVQMDYSTIDGEWGIVSIKDIETGEIFDINDYPELDGYWCLFNDRDAIRIVVM